MATKRECDRCGVQQVTTGIDKPSDWGTLNVPRIQRSNKTIGADARTLDICPRCITDLHRFAERLVQDAVAS